MVDVLYRFKSNITSTVRVDCHSSFKALRNDKILLELGIALELGDEKNINKNGVAEKAIQELEDELLKVNPKNEELNEILLSRATYNLNSRVRFTKRSSKELWFKRDQNTGDHLEFNDEDISQKQFERRRRDNEYKKKVKKTETKPKDEIKPGDLVVIRGEKDKSRNRDTYLVTEVENSQATCIKTNSRSRGTPYKVKLQDLFKLFDGKKQEFDAETTSESDDPITAQNENVDAAIVDEVNETVADENIDDDVETEIGLDHSDDIVQETGGEIEEEPRDQRKSKRKHQIVHFLLVCFQNLIIKKSSFHF